MRVVGADANPYWLATSLTGMYGVKNNLKLEVEATREMVMKTFNGTPAIF